MVTSDLAERKTRLGQRERQQTLDEGTRGLLLREDQRQVTVVVSLRTALASVGGRAAVRAVGRRREAHETRQDRNLTGLTVRKDVRVGQLSFFDLVLADDKTGDSATADDRHGDGGTPEVSATPKVQRAREMNELDQADAAVSLWERVLEDSRCQYPRCGAQGMGVVLRQRRPGGPMLCWRHFGESSAG